MKLPEVAIVEMNGDGEFDRIAWICGCVTERKGTVVKMWLHTSRCDAHPGPPPHANMTIDPATRDDVRRDWRT